MANQGGSPTYFVTQTNPEIFSVTPRPGGLAKIDLPPPRNRLKENAAKLKKESMGASTTSARTSRAKLKASTSKVQSADANRDQSQSRKSLLTISSAYNEPKDLDMDTCPREFKVKQIIAATPWSVEFDEYLEPTEESRRIPDPFQDSVDMLAMSISVIMLLSRGYDQIDRTHFKWVWSYLDCIRDEFGHSPPNIQGILNHINQLTGGEMTSFLDEEYEPQELPHKATSVKISSSPAIDDTTAESS